MAKSKKKPIIPRTKENRKSFKDRMDEGTLGFSYSTGKPNDMSLSDWVKSVLSIVSPNGKTVGSQIIERQAVMAAAGDKGAAEFLFDRAYGKPTQSINVSTPPPIVVEHQTINLDQVNTE